MNIKEICKSSRDKNISIYFGKIQTNCEKKLLCVYEFTDS